MDLQLANMPQPLDAREFESPVLHGRLFKWRGCSVIISRELDGLRLLWHAPIAHPERYPTWDEIRDMRYAFLPDNMTMAMLLPPKAEYVNLHPNCFHLWEVDDPRA